MRLHPSLAGFKSLKVRHLIGVNFIAILVFTFLSLASGLMINQFWAFHLVYCLSMIITTWWTIQKCKEFQIDLRQVIGAMPRKIPWLKLFYLEISMTLFTLSSVMLLLWLVSIFSPGFFEQFYKGQSSTGTTLTNASSVLEKILTFFTLVIVAPITEEFLFRGIILQRWTEKWGIMKGLIATSVLFGFGHANNPIGLSMFGLIMGLLYLQTRTLWIPIILHAMNNFLVFIVIFMRSPRKSVATRQVLESYQVHFQHYGWVYILLTIISLIMLLRYIKPNFPKQHPSLQQ
jgi:uncharacterized protein